MKPKIKDGKVKIFNLDENEHNLIEQLTKASEFKSQSEFIGWLVRNYAISKDPVKELEQIRDDKKRLQNQIKEFEEKESQIIERMKAYKEDEKSRQEIKEKAIRILRKKIEAGENRFDIEDVARYWAFRLNLDMKQLIYEAGSEISKMNKLRSDTENA